jgi:hypothetical protein
VETFSIFPDNALDFVVGRGRWSVEQEIKKNPQEEKYN